MKFENPPLADQNNIVSKIDEFFSRCKTLKEKIMKSQEIKGLLAKTVVEKR